MDYIIVDFEWNQPQSEATTVKHPIRFESEIIEIGAVKLNEDFEKIGEFRTFIKPHFYPVMNGKVSRITRINSRVLASAPSFPEAFHAFSAWSGNDNCLCIWGRNDIPVLYDNLIMHGISLIHPILWCDLQRIFGSEIMRDSRQWSLTAAVDLLNLPKERAHDALNDALNTYSICTRVDLLPFCDCYANCYVDYDRDRLNGLVTGRAYDSLDAAHEDRDLFSVICPCCGEEIILDDWVRSSKKAAYSYGRCSDGLEVLARYQMKDGSEKRIVARTVYEMNDVLWDDYQDALDRESCIMASAV